MQIYHFFKIEPVQTSLVQISWARMKFAMATLAVVCVLCFFPHHANAQMVQIFNGQDANFGTWSPGEGMRVHQQEVCVFKTGTFDSTWDVTVTGDGAGGAFELTSVSGTLPITSIQINAVETTAGVLLTGNPGADITGFPDCTEFGRDNQALRFAISVSDLESAPPGTYTGTITLVARP